MAAAYDAPLDASAPAEPPPQRPAGSGRRWLRRLWVLALLAAVLVLIAPTAISVSNFRDTLLAAAMPEGGWKATTTGGSFSWVGGQTLTGLVVTDPEGELFFRADRVTLDRSLGTLVLDGSRLGMLSIDRPRLRLETRNGRTNLDEFLAGYESTEEAAPEPDEASPATELLLRVSEGVASTEDAADPGRSWSFSGLNLDLDLQSSGGPAVDGEAVIHRGGVDADGRPAGPEAGRVRFTLAAGDAAGREIRIVGDHVPLQAFEPFLGSALPGARLDGLASIDATVDLSGEGPTRSIQSSGRFEAERFAMTCDALKGDVLESAVIGMPWEASFADGVLRIGRAELDAGWLTARLSGAVNGNALAQDPADALRRSGLRVNIEADAAKLARSLPRTLHLKQGVTIDGGKLLVQAGPEGDSAWRVVGSLAEVSGSNNGRPVAWREPIEVSALVSPGAGGARLERVNLSAPFAKAVMETENDSVTADFELSLDRLATQAGQLIDLGGATIQGTALGRVTLSQTSADGFRGNASVQVRNASIASGADVLLAEPRLDVTASAEGTRNGFRPISLAQGRVDLRGRGDQLELELTEPARLGDATSVAVRARLQGPLATWAQRLRPWVGAVDGLSGSADADVLLGVTGDVVEARDARVTLTNFRLGAAGQGVSEPRLELTGSAVYDNQTGGVSSKELQLVGSTVALRAADVFVDPGGVAPRASGTIAYRADLRRLAGVLGSGSTGSTVPVGVAVGNVQLRSEGNALVADLTASAEPLQVLQVAADGSESVAWNEPRLNLEGQASFDPGADRVALTGLQITGQTLRLTVDAKVDQLSQSQLVEANGNLEYDPRQLASLISAYAGPGVQLGGDGRVAFRAAGSLAAADPSGPPLHWSRTLQAESAAGWSGGALYGIPIGGGRLDARLADGRVDVVPVELAVGQGKLLLRPTMTLDPAPQELVLPAGPVVSGLAISPEVSEAILKYVAPVLAGTTRAQGKFSVELDGVRVPLAEPSRARVGGRLDVQDATLSPGPIIQQVSALVERVEAIGSGDPVAAASPSNSPLLSIQDKQVTFQVADGRVYHRGLEFLIDEVPVTSSGSVGFDQTLAITFEVPIQQKWLGTERALQGLAGQVIEIPVTGTFQYPRIDERAIAGLTQKVIESAASSVIGDELNRQFKKLFKSR
ncbi:MAG: hypothetical protein AAGA92_05870 [Planctomycetota bacterium]